MPPPGEDSGEKFLEFELEDTSLLRYPADHPTRPGPAFQPGDTVWIRITVDPNLLIASIEPSGLQFNPADPAELEIRYAEADDDYDDDGDPDPELEDEIDLWRQESPGDDWERVGDLRTLSWTACGPCSPASRATVSGSEATRDRAPAAHGSATREKRADALAGDSRWPELLRLPGGIAGGGARGRSRYLAYRYGEALYHTGRMGPFVARVKRSKRSPAHARRRGAAAGPEPEGNCGVRAWECRKRPGGPSRR